MRKEITENNKEASDTSKKRCVCKRRRKTEVRPAETVFRPENNIPVCVYGPPEYFRNKAKELKEEPEGTDELKQ